MANWNKQDLEMVEKFIAIRNKGYYCSGTEVTDVYNRVLGKNLRPTNCGQCIRQRIQELEVALNAFKKLSEKTQTEQKTEDVTEEKVTEPENVTPEKEPKKETKKTGTKKK